MASWRRIASTVLWRLLDWLEKPSQAVDDAQSQAKPWAERLRSGDVPDAPDVEVGPVGESTDDESGESDSDIDDESSESPKTPPAIDLRNPSKSILANCGELGIYLHRRTITGKSDTLKHDGEFQELVVEYEACGTMVLDETDGLSFLRTLMRDMRDGVESHNMRIASDGGPVLKDDDEEDEE